MNTLKRHLTGSPTSCPASPSSSPSAAPPTRRRKLGTEPVKAAEHRQRGGDQRRKSRRRRGHLRAKSRNGGVNSASTSAARLGDQRPKLANGTARSTSGKLARTAVTSEARQERGQPTARRRSGHHRQDRQRIGQRRRRSRPRFYAQLLKNVTYVTETSANAAPKTAKTRHRRLPDRQGSDRRRRPPQLAPTSREGRAMTESRPRDQRPATPAPAGSRSGREIDAEAPATGRSSPTRSAPNSRRGSDLASRPFEGPAPAGPSSV